MKDSYLAQYEKDLTYLNNKKKRLLKELNETDAEINKIQGYCREIIRRKPA